MLRKVRQQASRLIEKINHPVLCQNVDKLNIQPALISYHRDFLGRKTIFDGFNATYRCNDLLSPDKLNIHSHNADSLIRQQLLCKAGTVRCAILLSTVEAIAESKSAIHQYESLYAFGKESVANHLMLAREKRWRAYFDQVLKEALQEGKRSFYINTWAPVLRWENYGGSHRFAAAYYVGKEQGFDESIDATLNIYQPNYAFISQLLERFDCYILRISDEKDYLLLFDCIDKVDDRRLSTIMRVHAIHVDEQKTVALLLLLHRKAALLSALQAWIQRQLQARRIIELGQWASKVRAQEGAIKRQYRLA